VSQDIVQFGFDGAVRSRWPLVERLDPQRIGFDSLDLLGGGYDWSHANAIVEDPGGFVVSVPPPGRPSWRSMGWVACGGSCPTPTGGRPTSRACC
jgi:hypothetical protein